MLFSFESLYGFKVVGGMIWTSFDTPFQKSFRNYLFSFWLFGGGG